MPIPDDLKLLYAAALDGDEAALAALADRLADLGANAIAAVLSHRLALPTADRTLWHVIQTHRVSSRLFDAFRRMFPDPDHVLRGRWDTPDLSRHALLSEVVTWSARQVRALGGVGKVTLQEMRQLLWEYGLVLKGEKTPAF